MYAVCSLALLRLVWTRRMGAATMRALPLALTGIVATGYSLWAIVGAGSDATLWGCVLFACGAPVYYLVRRKPG